MLAVTPISVLVGAVCILRTRDESVSEVKAWPERRIAWVDRDQVPDSLVVGDGVGDWKVLVRVYNQSRIPQKARQIIDDAARLVDLLAPSCMEGVLKRFNLDRLGLLGVS